MDDEQARRVADRTTELVDETGMSWNQAWKAAARELGVPYRRSPSKGCLAALWIVGLQSTAFLVLSLAYVADGGSDMGVIFIFFWGLPGIPLLALAAILTFAAWRKSL